MPPKTATNKTAASLLAESLELSTVSQLGIPHSLDFQRAIENNIVVKTNVSAADLANLYDITA